MRSRKSSKARNFSEDRQEHGTQDHPEHIIHPSQDHHGDDDDREDKVKVLRRDETHIVGVDRPRHAAEKRRRSECQDLIPGHIDPWQRAAISSSRIAFQVSPNTGVMKAMGHDDRSDHHEKDKIEEVRLEGEFDLKKNQGRLEGVSCDGRRGNVCDSVRPPVHVRLLRRR